MSVQVTVTLGDDGLVAVKRASSDAAVERLRAEAYRLRRAGHPGVVALVRHRRVPGGEELHLRYAGDPVERWRGTLAQAAGLAAAVAATLADLHDLGLVHGRLDTSHVLVGHDGRPRLCGLSDPGEAAAADDVLAVGRLVEVLLDRVAEPRRGPFAWSGSRAGERKAVARVVARALDPEPGRRPSARSLARSMLTAVHGAELPPRTDEADAIVAAERQHPAQAGEHEPSAVAASAGQQSAGALAPAAARPGRQRPPDPRAHAAGAGTPAVASSLERPAGPAAASTTATRPGHEHPPDPPADDGREQPPPGDAVPDALPSRAPAGGGSPDPSPASPATTVPLAAPGREPAVGAPGEPAPDDEVWRIGTPFRGPALAPAGETGDAQDEPWVNAWSLDPATSIDATDLLPWDRAGGAESGADDGGSALNAWLAWSVSAGLERPLPRPEPNRSAPSPSEATETAAATATAASGSDARAATAATASGASGASGPSGAGASSATGRSAATANAGRRRLAVTGPVPLPRLGDGPRPASDGTREWSRDRLAEPGDEAVTTTGRRSGRNRRMLVGAATAGLLGAGIAAGALALARGPEPATGDPAATGCASVVEPTADVDGDGCPEAVTVQGNRVSAGGATWELGQPGDVVAVGDWDCDGAATSALLRPGTGDVFVFAGWSGEGKPVTVTPTRSVPGGVALRVDRRSAGCDALVVEAADGAGTVVEEARA